MEYHQLKKTNGDYSTPSGVRLVKIINAKVHGHVVTSHYTERAVGAGNVVDRRYAHATSDAHRGAAWETLLNETRPMHQAAAYAYMEKMSKTSKPVSETRVSWLNPGQQLAQRAPGKRFRNRFTIVTELLSKDAAWKSATPAAVAAAKAHAAVNRQKKVDRKSRSEVVANSKVDAVEVGAAKRRASTRMADINSETLEVRAAAVDPPRQPLGLIDSEQRQPASKEDLTQECEARGLEPKSGALRMKPRVSGLGEPKLKIDELKELLLPHCLPSSSLLEQKRPDKSDAADNASGADWGLWGHQKKKLRLVVVEAAPEQSPTAGSSATEVIALDTPSPTPGPDAKRSSLRAVGVRRQPSRFVN